MTSRAIAHHAEQRVTDMQGYADEQAGQRSYAVPGQVTAPAAPAADLVSRLSELARLRGAGC